MKSIQAGNANNIFMPVYTLAANFGQLIVLSLGIYLILKGQFTLGLLMSFISYVNNFYNPLRQLAALWANFQVAMAGWDCISKILSLDNNLIISENINPEPNTSFLSFRNVSFTYPDGPEVLHHVSFDLDRGKTYVFVGPTGGGKTTIASLIARLYDVTKGNIYLDHKNIQSYQPEVRTRKIGFILQEPFLFTGTVRDNILYGNEEFINYSNKQLIGVMAEAGLESLLERFENGLDAKIQTTGDGIGLGRNN